MSHVGRSTTNSRTIADTIVGDHTHTICGYSLLKGIGDGEPVASDRFSVGGHEWVLLFYPDGKKSSNADHGAVYPRAPATIAPHGAVVNVRAVPEGPADGNQPAERDGNVDATTPEAQPNGGEDALEQRREGQDGAEALEAREQAREGTDAPADNVNTDLAQHQQVNLFAQAAMNLFPRAQGQPVAPHRGTRRQDGQNEYCALFVALIGEGKDPQGVINTADGKVVRAFHRFTLVDQKQGRDITKGRQREDGAVKISCARQDPNARNCHGYRKFVKKSILEDTSKGYLLDDSIVIRYTIELVVSQGGALMSNKQAAPKPIVVPGATIGADLLSLLNNEDTADVTIRIVPDEDNLPSVSSSGATTRADEEATSGTPVSDRTVTVVPAHRLVLQARSPVFGRMLASDMTEGQTGVIVINDILPEVFRVLLYFMYSDMLPEDLRDGGMDITMAQHLLIAADRYQLNRLRTICEKHLCECLDTETVATTLMLADKSHADKLRQVCLTYVANNLSQVIGTSEYQRLTQTCHSMMNEIIQAVAAQNMQQTASKAMLGGSSQPVRLGLRPTPDGDDAHARHSRVRARRRDEDGIAVPRVTASDFE